ncbi:hypothetical protein D3C81_782490 [compost metagenome]
MPPINSDGFGSTGVNLCLMVRMSNCVAAMLRVHRYNQFFVAVRTQSDGALNGLVGGFRYCFRARLLGAICHFKAYARFVSSACLEQGVLADE